MRVFNLARPQPPRASAGCLMAESQVSSSARSGLLKRAELVGSLSRMTDDSRSKAIDFEYTTHEELIMG